MAPSKEVSVPQPDAPKKSASPLEALAPNPHFQQSFLGKYGYAMLGGTVGGLTIAVGNYQRRRPLLAGKYPVP